MIDIGAITGEQLDTWHVIKLKAQRSKDTIIWCLDYESDGKFAMGHSTFWFEKEEDASMFALRWL